MSNSGDEEQHSSFIKSPQQLVVVMLASFLVPILGIVLVAQLAIGRPVPDPATMTPEAVAVRLAPLGRVEIAATSAAGAAQKGAADGKSVFDRICTACHTQSVAGSPKLGDKAAWAPRIKTGMNSLMQSVAKGKGAMPPKAGNPALTDAEIRAAIDFMVSQSK